MKRATAVRLDSSLPQATARVETSAIPEADLYGRFRIGPYAKRPSAGFGSLHSRAGRQKMAIDISTDEDGHSLRTLVWQAIRLYPTESLFQFLKDPSSIVRTIAARELQTRPELEVVFDRASVLVEAKRWRDREIGAFLLGQIGTPNRPLKAKSVPLLEGLCSDVHPDVRATALASLGHLGATESDATFRKALLDPDPSVSEMATEVLDWLGIET